MLLRKSKKVVAQVSKGCLGGKHLSSDIFNFLDAQPILDKNIVYLYNPLGTQDSLVVSFYTSCTIWCHKLRIQIIVSCFFDQVVISELSVTVACFVVKLRYDPAFLVILTLNFKRP